MPVTVRKLDQDDWKTVREIRLRALLDAPESFWSTYEQARDRDEDGWRSPLAAADAVTLLAEIDGRAVGMIAGMPAGAEERVENAGMMVAMWVEPEARGRGAADALVTSLIDWSRSQGHAHLVLWVYDAAPRAAAFYRRAGFHATGRVEIFNDDGRPLTLMTMNL